jgi:hypothetical protein
MMLATSGSDVDKPGRVCQRGVDYGVRLWEELVSPGLDISLNGAR